MNESLVFSFALLKSVRKVPHATQGLTQSRVNVSVLSVCVCSMGLKVPAVVVEAKAALDAGQCVVIGLQSTGEVSQCVCERGEK